MRVYGKSPFLVFFTLFANVSAIKMISEKPDRSALYILSSGWKVGGNHEVFRFLDGVLRDRGLRFESFPLDDVPDNEHFNDILLRDQLLHFRNRVIMDLGRKLRTFMHKFDINYLFRKLEEFEKMISTQVKEETIRRRLVYLLKLSGLIINEELSGKPGQADIIVVAPVRLAIELKVGTANRDAVIQVINYVESYRYDPAFGFVGIPLKWIPIVMAHDFTLDAVGYAKDMGVSLLKYDDIIHLIKLLSIYGFSEEMFRRVFVPGLSGDFVRKELSEKERLLDELAIVLASNAILERIESVYQLRNLIKYSFNRDVSPDFLNELLSVFKLLPVEVVKFHDKAYSFNKIALFFSLPRFINYLLLKVSEYENVSRRNNS